MQTPEKPSAEIVCENWTALREKWRGFSELDSNSQRQWCFRGQGHSAWKLASTLDRQYQFSDDESRNRVVERLHSDFKRELFYVCDERVTAIEGEALELLARHNGLPSPLMDWSVSPYVASYFAFEDALRAKSESACVWALNRTKFVPSTSTIDLIDDFELLRFNLRALHQRGLFLRVSTISEEVESLLAGALTKFVVPITAARSALVDLEMMTINATYLFGNEEAAAHTAALRQLLRGG